MARRCHAPAYTPADPAAFIAAGSVACCIPIVLLERGNITIRLLAGVAGTRAGRIADLGATLLVEVLLFGLAWQFFSYARQAARAGLRWRCRRW